VRYLPAVGGRAVPQEGTHHGSGCQRNEKERLLVKGVPVVAGREGKGRVERGYAAEWIPRTDLKRSEGGA